MRIVLVWPANAVLSNYSNSPLITFPFRNQQRPVGRVVDFGGGVDAEEVEEGGGEAVGADRVAVGVGVGAALVAGAVDEAAFDADAATEQATLREGLLCQREDITINIFLLPTWAQSEEDVRFAYRLAESTTGRVFFTAGRDLDRYVVWDYVNRKREIVA